MWREWKQSLSVGTEPSWTYASWQLAFSAHEHRSKVVSPAHGATPPPLPSCVHTSVPHTSTPPNGWATETGEVKDPLFPTVCAKQWQQIPFLWNPPASEDETGKENNHTQRWATPFLLSQNFGTWTSRPASLRKCRWEHIVENGASARSWANNFLAVYQTLASFWQLGTSGIWAGIYKIEKKWGAPRFLLLQICRETHGSLGIP